MTIERNDLGAFNEIIDLIESELKSSDDDKTYNSPYADAETNSFLEYEEQRLTKLDNLLSRKVENLITNTQLPKIIKKEQDKKDETKDILILKLMNPQSGLNQEMSRMFRSMFGVFTKGPK